MSIKVKELRAMAKDRMCIDLEKLLDVFTNKDIGLRILSEKTGVGEKTLKRVLKKESDPHVNTMTRFYSYFLKYTNINIEEDRFYHGILNLIKYDNPLFCGSDRTVSSLDLESILAENKVFREILFYASTGKVTLDWIRMRFGEYGMEVLELMIKENVIQAVDKDIYTKGEINIPCGARTCKILMQHLLADHLTVAGINRDAVMMDLYQEYKDLLEKEEQMDNKQNTGFFLLDGVSEKFYQKAIERLISFRNEITAGIHDPENKGDHRLLILGVVDKLDNGPQTSK